MAELFRGRWRITVTGKDAAWDQRVVIAGSTNADGQHPGTVGHSFIVDGRAGWQLTIQHNDGSGWADSLIRRVGRTVAGTSVRLTVESEDLPDREPKDWNDLVLRVETDGPILEIPIRPYAIEPRSLQMMPDGIFEASLGQYFMGVRVTNIWDEPFKSGQFVEITPHSRAVLATQGIQVVDAWSLAELQALQQTLHGTGVVIGPLAPFESRTVYFKVNCAAARPHKPAVEFICLEPGPMPDPAVPARRASHQIYVSRSRLDPATHEMIAEVPEGRVRMVLREAIVDVISAQRGRRRRPPAPTPLSTPAVDELRKLLADLLAGRRVDVCILRQILACYCECKDFCEPPLDPTRPRDGRFEYEPFLVLPTKFSYTVETIPYTGQFGPLPFQDPWWKIALLIAFLVAGMLSEAADRAYNDEDLIIGTLDEWQQNDIDAALVRLNDRRTLANPFLQYLDAQSGEISTVPIEPAGAPALGGNVSIPNPGVMTRAEVNAAVSSSNLDDKRVFKSGARTGLTHALIGGWLVGPHTRKDDGTIFNIDQVAFIRDPDNDMPISRKGDSGSVWIHKSTLKLVALHHSGYSDESEEWTAGDTEYALGSLMEDVVARLGIIFS